MEAGDKETRDRSNNNGTTSEKALDKKAKGNDPKTKENESIRILKENAMDEKGKEIDKEEKKSDEDTTGKNKVIQSAERRETIENDTCSDVETENISEKEAETRFMLWYTDKCNERTALLETIEWYKRRIMEMETLEERQKERITQLKDNEGKLLQRIAEAQLKIKILRRKSHSTEDDLEFNKSCKAFSMERDRLHKVDRENRETIKCLKKEIRTMRGLNNMKYTQKYKMNKKKLMTSAERMDNATQTIEVAGPINGQPKCQVKTENSENSLLSKTEVTETIALSGRSVPKENVYDKKKGKFKDLQEKEMTGKDDGKKKSTVSLPDIRTRSGYRVWRN